MAVRLTRHARMRARRRQLPLEVIDQVYREPDHIRQSQTAPDREIRSRTYDDQVIEIVVDTVDGSVVTVWHRPVP